MKKILSIALLLLVIPVLVFAGSTKYYGTQNPSVIAYGVQWDESNPSPTLTRLGSLANSASGTSPGNALLPIQSQMRRCILSDAGVVQYYLKYNDSYNRAGIAPSVTGTDDAGTANKLSDNGVFTDAESAYKGRYVHNTTDDTYAMITAKDSDNVLSIDADIMDNGETFEICTAVLNGDDGQVMVEIPRFAYRYSYDSDLKQHQWWIAPTLMPGYEWHPAFYKDGEWVEYRYIGAYEGVGYDDSTSAYFDGDDPDNNPATNWPGGTAIDTANDKLGSVSGYAPLVNETRAEFRAIASNRGAGWRQQDFYLVSAIQLLYLVEYASFYSQDVIGMGRTELTGGTWAKDSYIGVTGKSNSDGNATANVGGNTNDAYMSYRGIEHFYGNIWKFVDGFNLNDGIPYVCNDETLPYADDTATGYIRLEDTGGSGITLPQGSDNYQTTLEQTKGGFLPSAVGGSSSTYITDYYQQNTGWRVVTFGGSANQVSKAGFFDWHLSYLASDDNIHVGSRVAY